MTELIGLNDLIVYLGINLTLIVVTVFVFIVQYFFIFIFAFIIYTSFSILMKKKEFRDNRKRRLGQYMVKRDDQL